MLLWEESWLLNFRSSAILLVMDKFGLNEAQAFFEQIMQKFVSLFGMVQVAFTLNASSSVKVSR